MTQFKFEITITEQDLEGDAFWEDAIEKDGTGIMDLTQLIKEMVKENIVSPTWNGDINEVVKLKEFKL